MKKRVVCVFLLLSTLLSTFPILSVSAEEILPKDETADTSALTPLEGTHSFTEYDALYVGADGGKTANGGRLLGLYTAYGDDATVKTEDGKWQNKMDATGATDIVLRDTLDGIDFVKETSGFGYHLTATSNGMFREQSVKIGLTLPGAWAELPQFTVEHSARLDVLPANECYAWKIGGIRLDLLQGLWMPSGFNLTRNDSYCMRWSITGALDYANNYTQTQEYAYREAYSSVGREAGMVAAYTKTTDANGSVRYLISYNTGLSYPSAKTYTASELDAMRATAKNDVPAFSLFNGMSGTFYAVRVYDAPLTEAEKKHNAVIDVFAHAQADVTDYLRLDASTRAVLNENLCTLDIAGEEASVSATIEALVSSFADAVDPTETLYTTEGLTFFASAYETLSTGAYASSGALNWLNALDPAEFATLRGGFAENEKGGYTVVKDLNAYNQDSTFGIYMPTTALPSGDYTVEWVYNPVGISVLNEDGVSERYVDDVTPTGTYHKMGIAIGPLRALQFSCYRPSGRDGQLERRWYYSATEDIGTLGWKYHHADTSWDALELNAVMCYTVTHDLNVGGSRYRFYDNGLEQESLYDISAEEYRTPEEAGNKFQLLLGVAGTAYAIRVYDRPLSRTEVLRNHLADLVYFYGFDASIEKMLMKYVEKLGTDASVLFEAYADLSFTMTREEAEALFVKRFSTIWLAYEGVGVRKEAGKDGFRYYFTCHTSAAAAMRKSGFTVELGALANVDKNVLPTLEGNAYDYKINAYSSDSGRNARFFVDEDTFGVTLLYKNLNKKTSLTSVSVRGYVKLTAPDGTELVYYTDTDGGEGNLSNLFEVYYHMKDADSVREDAQVYGKLTEALEKCYERITVNVKAGAAADGDGSVAAPFHSFAQGFAKCKELLAKANVPTRLYLMLEDGEYGIYEKQILTDADMLYKYASFEITSKNGKSTLTTTKNIDKGFTEYADNIWVCQLDKAADGSYPCFRYLYVDGTMADLSYAGGRYSADEDTYVTAFERAYDGPWGRASELYSAGLLTAESKSGYPASRPDLNEAFETYKKGFLALGEMEAQFKAHTLKLDSVCESTDSEYVALYEGFKLTRLAIEDLKAQYGELKGTSAERKAAFNALAPKDYSGNAYRDAFVSLRKQIGSNQSINFSYYEPMVATTAEAEAKYYLHEDIVGDLRAAMERGRERNEAAYKALQGKYDAASAAERAELEDDLLLAKEKAGEYTWFRYALEGYGPEMHLAGQWWYNIIHVSGVDYEDVAYDKNGDPHVAVYLEKDEYRNYYVHENYTMANRYVHLKGALSYVDSEGEYYYDELSGKVYYYSEGGVNGKTLAYATSDYMFFLDGVRDLTISDLRITGVDDAYLSHNDGCMDLGTEGGTGELINDGSGAYSAFDRSAILLDDCYGLSVFDCTFDELGARAIYGTGVLKNIHVEGNNFVNLGANAIHFGNGTKERVWKTGVFEIEDVTVTNNYIHDVAREYYNASAIWINLGKDLSITYNTVDKCSYTAISVGYTFNLTKWDPGAIYHMYNVEIAYNYVTGFMHEIGDGGGIYVTGCNASTEMKEYFNSIHHNYVFMSNTTGNGLGHMLVGIYLDGSTSNWRCYENVVTEQSYGALPSENEGYDLSDEKDVKYLTALRNRYSGSTFIYIQHIDGQITHNNLMDNNYIVNVRATEPEAQRKEVYKTYIVPDRNIIERNTRYVQGVDRIPAGAEDIIYGAGSYGHTGDPSVLWNNDY